MKRIIYILSAVFILTGCSSLRNVGFRNYDNSFTKDLNKHTKSVTLYRDFTTIAIAQATHFNKSLMKKYIKYTQKIDVQKAKKYRKLLKEFDKYDIYWLAFYTPDDDINNLSSKSSFWNVYLSRDSNIISAVNIKEVGINDMTKQWLYFVKANRWARQYIIKFKKQNNLKSKKSCLVLSSFLGTIEIKFNN